MIILLCKRFYTICGQTIIHLSWSVNTDTILTVSSTGSSDRLGGLCMAQTPEGHASRVHQCHWRHDVPEGPEVLSHVSQSLLHWLPHRLRRNFCMVSHPKREQGEQYIRLMMCQVLLLLFYIYRCIKDALLTLDPKVTTFSWSGNRGKGSTPGGKTSHSPTLPDRTSAFLVFHRVFSLLYLITDVRQY